MPQPDLRVLSDRYEMVDRVGRGGMGAVWRARDLLLGRDVAVKEILLPPGLDEEELASVRGRALREARAAAQVRHPAVVTIHDVVIEDGHPWIVMDFVRSRSLADRLAEDGALPVAEVVRIGTALAGALRAVHDRGIVHRDLKPANILIDADGHVVLTDFGIATIEGDARFTASGVLIGTLAFMAPERLSDGVSGPPSDLWALGAVLYAAVEGRRPYEGGTPMTAEPAPPHKAGPLAPLINDLLAWNPADRPDARRTAERLAAIALDPSTRVDAAPPVTSEPTVREPAPATRRIPAPGGKEIGDVPDWLRGPAPVREPVRPPRWWNRVLSPGRITAAVAIVAVGGGVIWLVDTVSAGHANAPTVDPCSMLSANQVATLTPNARRMSLSSTECNWRGNGDTDLSVSVTGYPTVDKTTVALHTGQSTYISEPSLDISGVGNEVYAYADQANGQTVVLLRRDRYVAQIEYNGAADDVEQRSAFQAARWVDEGLGTVER